MPGAVKRKKIVWLAFSGVEKKRIFVKIKSFFWMTGVAPKHSRNLPNKSAQILQTFVKKYDANLLRLVKDF